MLELVEGAEEKLKSDMAVARWRRWGHITVN